MIKHRLSQSTGENNAGPVLRNRIHWLIEQIDVSSHMLYLRSQRTRERAIQNYHKLHFRMMPTQRANGNIETERVAMF